MGLNAVSLKSTNTAPVVVLVGPTCVGKTALSIILAKALNTEIISADSMQIYSSMDIGTSKPSQRELDEVKHHLINILSPGRSFSAGKFKTMAIEIIDSMKSKGKTPIIVGGTGLYIRALTRGLFHGPGADWELRDKLIQEEKNYGEGYLYNRLKDVDPVTAGKTNRNDTRRIIRALEVFLKAGKTISELQDMSTTRTAYNFIKIGLSRERKELYRLIDQRVDTMMRKGLLQETESLLKTNPGRTPLQALGYKEMQLFLNGRVSMEESVDLLKKRTRAYAKRQYTWFNKEPGVEWVDITGIINAEDIYGKVVTDVEPFRKLLAGQEYMHI